MQAEISNLQPFEPSNLPTRREAQLTNKVGRISSKMLICSVCGKLNPEGSRNCDLCGAPLAGADRQSAAAMPAPVENGASSGLSGPICPKCRRPNRAASVFCAFCGYRLQDSNGAQPYTLPGNGHNPANSYSVGQHPTTVI